MKQEHSEGGEEDRTELQIQEESEDDDWSGVVPPSDIAEAVAEYPGTELCSLNFKKGERLTVIREGFLLGSNGRRSGCFPSAAVQFL